MRSDLKTGVVRRRYLGTLPGVLCACLVAGSLCLALWPETVRATSFRVLNLTQHSQEQFALLSISALGRVSALLEFKREVVRVDSTGTITPLPPVPFGQVRSSSINDAGQAVYLVERLCNETGECRADILFFDGSTFHTLMQGTFTTRLSLSGRALNTQGQIAFSAAPDEVFLFDGTHLQPLLTASSLQFLDIGPPILNDVGQVAFWGLTASSSHANIFLYDGAALLNVSDDPDLHITAVHGLPTLNNRGKVLFFADTTDAPNNLFLFDGTRTINLTTTQQLPATEPYSTSLVALNNQDQFVFLATERTDGARHLWWVDLPQGEVSKVTSRAPHSSIRSLFINDSPQIVFSAWDQKKGKSDIYLALPR